MNNVRVSLQHHIWWEVTLKRCESMRWEGVGEVKEKHGSLVYFQLFFLHNEFHIDDAPWMLAEVESHKSGVLFLLVLVIIYLVYSRLLISRRVEIAAEEVNLWQMVDVIEEFWCSYIMVEGNIAGVGFSGRTVKFTGELMLVSFVLFTIKRKKTKCLVLSACAWCHHTNIRAVPCDFSSLFSAGCPRLPHHL